MTIIVNYEFNTSNLVDLDIQDVISITFGGIRVIDMQNRTWILDIRTKRWVVDNRNEA